MLIKEWEGSKKTTMKKALITGITGQDGSYLAELLLEKGYQVIGMVSQEHDIGEKNINSFKKRLVLETGDLLDKQSLERIIKKYQPGEVYNLGAVTFVPQSWQKPAFTFDVNALGVIRLLQLVKDLSPKAKFFQATSAKIFGSPDKGPQTEESSVQPATPYAVSKACGHFLTQNFRDHFNLFACSGIMYNHESERRGKEFVTRKITSTAVRIKLGQVKKLVLGDLKAKEDWGYAPDYVEAMWLMLQQDRADDYILATGKQHSVADICQIAFGYLDLDWKKYVVTDKKFVRKEKEQNFFGNPSKAKKVLGWQPKTTFKQMVEKMVNYDWQLTKEEQQ